MSNINLLPEELRRKEEKEMKRIAKRPRRFEIELKMPEKEQPIYKQMDTAKVSWWKKLIGTKPKHETPEEQGLRVPKVYQPEYGVNLLSAKKPAPIRMRAEAPQYNAPSREIYSGAKPQPLPQREPRKKFSWSELFGKPSFPISTHLPKIHKEESKPRPAAPLRQPVPPLPKIKMAKPGFLNLLKSWLVAPQKPAKPAMFSAPMATPPPPPPPVPRPIRQPLPKVRKEHWWQALFAPKLKRQPQEIAFVDKQKLDLRRRFKDLAVKPRQSTVAPQPSIIKSPRKYFADSWARIFSFSRSKARSEAVKFVHEDQHRHISVAPLPKPPVPPLPKIKKPSFWSNLFKRKPKLPKTFEIKPAVSVAKPELKQLEPDMLFRPQLSAKPEKHSAWSELFKHEPKSVKPVAPKLVAAPKPVVPPLPKIKKPSLWSRLFKRKPKIPKPVLPLKPIVPVVPKVKKPSLWSRLFRRKPKLPKPVAVPKPVVPPLPKIKKPSFLSRLFQRTHKLSKTIEIKPDVKEAKPAVVAAKPASVQMGSGETKPSRKIEIKREQSGVEKAGILETMPLSAKDIKKFIKDTYKLIPKIERREFGVNLMPSDLVVKEKGNRQYQLAIIIFSIIIPAAAVFGAHLVLKSAQAKVDGQIASRGQKLAELNNFMKQYDAEQKKSQALRQKLLTAKKLLDDRIYWQGFFDQLEKYTLDGVYYTDLSLDTSGQLTLPVVANSYETGAKQIVAFREAKDFIKSVEVNSLSLTGDAKSGATGVSFVVKLSLVDGLFKQPVVTTSAETLAQ